MIKGFKILVGIGGLTLAFGSATLGQALPPEGRFNPPLTVLEQQELLGDSLVNDGARNVSGLAGISAGNAARALELHLQLVEAKRQIQELQKKIESNSKTGD